MTLDEALGWMAVTVLNEHFPHPDQPETWVEEGDGFLGTAGCVDRCGPCGALYGLSTLERIDLEHLITLTKFHEGGWSWWDDEGNKVRWEVLEAYWAGHHGCASVNGVAEPCVEEASAGPEGELDIAARTGRWILRCTACGAIGSYPGTSAGHDLAVHAWMHHSENVHGIPDTEARSLLLDAGDA